MTSTDMSVTHMPSLEQIQEDFERSRIYRAIRKGDSRRLLAAVHKGANIHLYDHEQLHTFLHLVVIMANPHTEDRFLPMVYVLSNYGVEVGAEDSRGRTALALAIHKQLAVLMEALIRAGTDLTQRDYRALIHRIDGPRQERLLNCFDKYEPGLWGAVKRGHSGLVQLLINSWCRVNTVRNNTSLINYATLTRKSQDLIVLLSEAEISLEFVHATLAGDERMMLEFLDKDGCDPHMMDISHQESGTDSLIPRSLRDTATAMGHTHVLHLLPESETGSDELEHELDDDDDLEDDVSYYSEAATNTAMPNQALCLNLDNLQLDDNECTSEHANYERDHSEIHRQPDADDIHATKRKSKKYKQSLYDSAGNNKGKSREGGLGDEGYSSTVSSGQSVSAALEEGRFTAGYGHYQPYYDQCYYYTAAAPDSGLGAMVSLSTPRATPRQHNSTKAKAKKQRARLYWQDDDKDCDAVPTPRKARRSRSKRDADSHAKSRTCVIS